MKHVTKKQWFFGVFGASLALVSLFIARPAAAEDSVEGVIDLFKEKIGFAYDADPSRFTFAKNTPNYRAFAGSVDPAQSHKIVLERDGAALELTFLSAHAPGEVSTQSVLGASTKVAHADQLILDRAEVLLLDQASMSAQGRNSIAPEQALSDIERQTVASAAAILDQHGAVEGVSSQSAEASASGNLDHLPQEAQDFALLMKLKAFKIKELSLDVDLKLAQLTQDISAILSQPHLIEEPTERVVEFANSAMGMDLEYRLNDRGIRQQIILNNREKVYDRYMFKLDTTGLKMEEKGHGIWYFRTLGNEELLRIPKGYAIDANKKFTNDVDIKIVKIKDIGDVVQVHVSDEWLMAQEREFPIVVETALEVIPELRLGHPKYKVPKHRRNVTPTPSLIPEPTDASGTVTPSPSSVASPSATPTVTFGEDATPSGSLESTTSALSI